MPDRAAALGASTQEAEDNCALMAADQVLASTSTMGDIVNSVNFPEAVPPAGRRASASASPTPTSPTWSARCRRRWRARVSTSSTWSQQIAGASWRTRSSRRRQPRQVLIDEIATIKGVLAARALST